MPRCLRLQTAALVSPSGGDPEAARDLMLDVPASCSIGPYNKCPGKVLACLKTSTGLAKKFCYVD